MSPRPVRLRAMAAAVGLVCLPTLGCSWIFIDAPPKGPISPSPPLKCTSERPTDDVTASAPEVFDCYGALLVGMGGVGAIAAGVKDDSSASIAAGIALLGAATALGFSAAYGGSAGEPGGAIYECSRLKHAQVECVSGVEEACRTLQERKPK